MKNILIIIVIVVAAFLNLAVITYASIPRDMGTTNVTLANNPEVTCSGTGPITITMSPIGSWSTTPYYVSPGTQAKSVGTIRTGVQVLAKYMPTMTVGSCYTKSTPPIPYPVFPILFYGASRT